MTKAKIETAAERYRKTPQTVEVNLPSGNTFLFRKPSKFSIVFRAGRLPQAAASSAVESWISAGILQPGEVDQGQADKIDMTLKLRDYILELSVDPKLVVGEAQAPNELSTDALTDEDAEYLFQWTAAGGEESAMLRNFPSGSSASAVSSSNGASNGVAAKSVNGA